MSDLKVEPDKLFIKETKVIALMQKKDMGGISPLSERLERLVSIIEDLEREKNTLIVALLEAADNLEGIYEEDLAYEYRAIAKEIKGKK